ncbi:MAG: hypothetical protein CMH66_11520 [Nioella sp.]|nr:hypothetical protein [Nioella sp.]
MRTAIVVTGFESSGSVFISKTISHVNGSCLTFGDWNGHGFNRPIGEDGIVLHRSIPYRRPRRWHDDPAELHEIFIGYDRIRFVLTTRDLSISIASRMRRFGGTTEDYLEDNRRTTRFLQSIMAREDHFIWNYETMCAFQHVYFQQLYAWLGIESSFLPDVVDANRRFLSTAELI